MIESFPVLYILMRTDLDSMNSGKGMAQASHASNAFVKVMNDNKLMSGDKALAGDVAFIDENATSSMHLFERWSTETTQGFGTVLVLGVNELEMRTAVTMANRLGYTADVLHDPTYPVRDGEICHTLPLDTCAYVFGDKNDPMLSALLGNFNLHP